ncbi:MAG: PKD domain-containing protein [Saprospiraceae bacterium]|nr:PKD domain-containing protein [Saprospiraceae bacterium]
MKKSSLFILPLLFVAFFACNKQNLLDQEAAHVLAPQAELVADFSIENPLSKVNESEPVLLSNLSQNAVAYHWDFGNGVTSNEKQPAFAYSKCGIFNITLTVTGADGTIKKARKEITSLCIFGGPHGSN